MKKISMAGLAASAITIMCIIIYILYPDIFSPRSFRKVYVYMCYYIIADSFILVVLLSILKIFSMAIFKKIVLYLSIAVAGSAFISLLLFAAYQLLIEKHCVTHNFLPYMLVESVFLVFFNFIISKKIFSVKIINAFFIGTAIGLINAFIGMPPLCL
jgi:hypothetical protein